MKIILTVIILVTLTVFCGAQTSPNPAPSNSSAAPNAVMAASGSLRITAPTIGERLGATQVTARYELTNPGADAASSPTYRVQLDGHDPDETLDTSYTFTGLAPGDHSIIVQLVDANHNPIGGSRAIVHFKTDTPGANPSGAHTNSGTGGGASAAPQTTSALTPPALIKAKLPLPSRAELPDAGGELPLLSLVGFGVLFGGAISAMRTRK